MKKTLMFTTGLPPVGNGVATAVAMLARDLQILGYESTIVAPANMHAISDPKNVIRIPGRGTPPKTCPYPVPGCWPYLLWLFGSHPPLEGDIVISHDPYLMGGLGYQEAKRQHALHVSVGHTAYQDYARCYPAHWPQFVRHYVNPTLNWPRLWLFYNFRCDAIIAPSQWQAEQLRKFGISKRKRIEVIPTSVPYVNLPFPGKKRRAIMQGWRKKLRKLLGVSPATKVILHLGRISEEKNIKLLVQAACETINQNPNEELLFVFMGAGDPKLIEWLRKKSWDFDNKIRVAESQPHAIAMELLGGADVLWLGSVTDTQALVVTEARRRGVPVVVTNLCGAHEGIRHGVTGMVVPADYHEIAAAVIRCLQTDMQTNADLHMDDPDRFSPEAVQEAWRLLLISLGHLSLREVP